MRHRPAAQGAGKVEDLARRVWRAAARGERAHARDTLPAVTDLVLRPARREDARVLWDLRTRSIRTLCAPFYPAEDVARWAATPMTHRFDEMLLAVSAVVADADGLAVGFGFIDRDDAELAAAYVDPDHARRGVGRRLVAALEDDAAAAGLEQLWLSASLNAVRFYEATGWTARGPEIWRHAGGFDLPCVRMDKRLDGGSSRT
jgi:putative acetyltransferase